MKYIPADNKSLVRFAPMLLAAVLWSVLYWLTPLFLDDYQFIGTYVEANNGSSDFSFAAWKEYMAELRSFDNSRIGNLLSPFTTMWSPWRDIFPWLTGCLTAVLFAFATRFAFGKDHTASAFMVMWFLLTLFLPWRNALLVRDYSLNYVYSGVVTFVAVWLIMGLRKWDGRFYLALLFAILAGGWHEGFAIPTLCGLGLVALIRRFRMTPQWWVAVIVYAVSGAIMTLSPGTLSRSTRELATTYNYLSLNFLFDMFPAALLIGTVLISLLFRRGRGRLARLCLYPESNNSDSWAFPLFGCAALVAGMFPFVINYTPRVCFWASVCSIIAWIVFMRPLWVRLRPWMRTTFGLIALIFCVVQLGISIYWENRVREEAQTITEAVRKSRAGTIFFDTSKNQDAPIIALHFPMLGMWDEPFNIACFGRALGNRDIAIVPLSLRYARPGDCQPVKAGFNLRLSPEGDALFAVPQSVPGYKKPDPGNMYIHRMPVADIVLKDGRRIYGLQIPFTYYINSDSDTLFRVYTPKINPSDIEELILKGPIDPYHD